MKILFISSLYAPDIGGGAEIILQRMVEGLQQRGYGVTVLCTTAQPGLHMDAVNQIKVYRAGLHNTYWHFTAQRPGRLARLGWHLRDRYNPGMRGHVKRVLELEQPDLVMCHNLTGWSVSAWDEISLAGLAVVQVLHDMYLLCPSSTMFKKGHSCQRQCGLCMRFRTGHDERSSQVDAVVGVSRFLLDSLQKRDYFKGTKSYVVYNASPCPAPAAEPCADTPTPSDAPLRFGYIGTLSDPKGVGWLIEQFQHLPFNATLQIAGRGQLNDEQRFKAMASSPNISFVGYQNPETFYKQIDVAIVPSVWNEPFGMVAVEACAHSRPVIASRMGGLTEIIKDQVNGLLCSPDDPDSLGLAMLKLHQQPRLLARLGAQARDSVREFLSLELMLDQYESILIQTLQDRIALPRLQSLPDTA
ncbi:Glycosyl transferase, group 1 protein [Pseudomonas cichorii]|uniref:Glycosyl transferase, group 1 protein n=1 Tax=Pseudomonas cichorii TaxID=36746 RepID=A0A3M4LMF0_PSECI|nr:glycosyltransferase family 4 protein [Pseudomonas cichorii]RMQ42685.1 Glycosyl transferase, group 1 protein [Pseudomonas cichorii]